LLMGDTKPEDVRAELERLYRYSRFRGAKLRRLLGLLVDEWLADGGKRLTEKYIGDVLNDEPLTHEPDTGKYGYPRTRANLGHVRSRLRTYYETAGYRDPVIIKLNPGSYAPQIAYNPISTAIPALDANSERLILRAKTALDMRTLNGAVRAMHYANQLDFDLSHPRLQANFAFFPFATAPLLPYAAHAFRPLIEDLVASVRMTGFEPWECTFANACIKASHYHDWKQALDLFETANANSQREAVYFWWYTALLASMGRMPESIDILDSAVRHFARTNIATRTDLAMLQTMAGNYVNAEETLSATLDFAAADNPAIVCHFAIFYEAQNRLAEAIDPLAKWMDRIIESGSQSDFSPETLTGADGHSLLAGMLGLITGRAGRPQYTERLLDGLLRRKNQSDKTSSVEIAIALLGLSRYDDALAWLNRAVFEEGDPMAMWFHIFPPLRHLRGHRGFRALLKELKLPVQLVR
jgi:tetratricopeptide (TPR) repeat protein